MHNNLPYSTISIVLCHVATCLAAVAILSNETLDRKRFWVCILRCGVLFLSIPIKKSQKMIVLIVVVRAVSLILTYHELNSTRIFHAFVVEKICHIFCLTCSKPYKVFEVMVHIMWNQKFEQCRWILHLSKLSTYVDLFLVVGILTKSKLLCSAPQPLHVSLTLMVLGMTKPWSSKRTNLSSEKNVTLKNLFAFFSLLLAFKRFLRSTSLHFWALTIQRPHHLLLASCSM